MEFTIKSGSPEKQRSACVVVGVFDNRKLSLSAELIDRASNGYISEIIRRGDMEGKLGATLLLHNVRGTLADRVLLVGLGKERDFRDREFRSAIRSAVKLLNETGSYEAVVYLTEEKVKRREVAWRVEHARRGRHGGRLPLRADEKPAHRGAAAAAQADAVGAAALGPDRRRDGRGAGPGDRPRHGHGARPRQHAGQHLHADLPRGERAKQLGAEFPDVKVTILERKECEELGMGSFLSVTNGSDEPPRFIVLEYMQSQEEPAPSPACWSARASRSTPAAFRSSPASTWTR